MNSGGLARSPSAVRGRFTAWFKSPSPGVLLLKSTTTIGATSSSIEARGTRQAARD